MLQRACDTGLRVSSRARGRLGISSAPRSGSQAAERAFSTLPQKYGLPNLGKPLPVTPAGSEAVGGAAPASSKKAGKADWGQSPAHSDGGANFDAAMRDSNVGAGVATMLSQLPEAGGKLGAKIASWRIGNTPGLDAAADSVGGVVKKAAGKAGILGAVSGLQSSVSATLPKGSGSFGDDAARKVEKAVHAGMESTANRMGAVVEPISARMDAMATESTNAFQKDLASTQAAQALMAGSQKVGEVTGNFANSLGTNLEKSGVGAAAGSFMNMIPEAGGAIGSGIFYARSVRGASTSSAGFPISID